MRRPARLVLVAGPAEKRTRALLAAAEVAKLPTCVVPWSAFLDDPSLPGREAGADDVLRVDTPGGDTAVWSRLSGMSVAPTEWRPGRAWFAGLSAQLRAVTTEARQTHPAETCLAMVDKWSTQARLEEAGVAIPPAELAPPTPEALWARVTELRWGQVFVKGRWGSSGAGVFAARRGEVVTTAVLDGGRVHNDKRLRRYTGAEADAVLAPVLADGALLQRWIPKAGAGDRPFDLRAVLVEGRLTHLVARLGRGPITNLHLDSLRADPADVCAANVLIRVGELAVATARLFPTHHTFGIDILVDSRGKPWVIECNAWGDHVPGWPGLDDAGDPFAAVMRSLAA